jgi:hypothetical protein
VLPRKVQGREVEPVALRGTRQFPWKNVRISRNSALFVVVQAARRGGQPPP